MSRLVQMLGGLGRRMAGVAPGPGEDAGAGAGLLSVDEPMPDAGSEAQTPVVAAASGQQQQQGGGGGAKGKKKKGKR